MSNLLLASRPSNRESGASKLVPRPLAAIEMLYAGLPSIHCVGRCQDSCGPIDAHERERLHFEKRTGRSFPDALIVLNSAGCACPLLEQVTGTCAVYRNRPLICRLWGLVESMRCPHGCVPSRWLTDNEARNLLDLTASDSGERPYTPDAEQGGGVANQEAPTQPTEAKKP